MEQMQSTESNNNTKTARPTMLTVLCILTFIGSGLPAISNFLWFFLYDIFLEIMAQNTSELFQQMYDVMLITDRKLFIADFVLCLGSLSGAILMFKLKKLGFHIYTISNVLLSLTPVFFTEGQSINYFVLFFITIPFVLLYALHLKHMK